MNNLVFQIVVIQFSKDQKNLQASGLHTKTAISHMFVFGNIAERLK